MPLRVNFIRFYITGQKEILKNRDSLPALFFWIQTRFSIAGKAGMVYTEKKKRGDFMEEKKLFDDSDLADLFEEFQSEENQTEAVEDLEMEASQRRYQEIIKKRKE